MSENSDYMQTDKIGVELTQEELDQVDPIDWKLYFFWQDIKEITLENYSQNGGSTLRGDNFGQGEEIIDRFEDRVSDEYTQKELDYLEQICEEYGFDRTVTAEMHEHLEETDSDAVDLLNRLEDDEPLDALTVQNILSTTKNLSRQRFREYKS